MLAILRRLWPRRRAAASITMGVHAVAVPKPIPLKEREPWNDDYCGNFVWWGFWDVDRWLWHFQECPDLEHTHWLPASVEVLPARCCPPEVES